MNRDCFRLAEDQFARLERIVPPRRGSAITVEEAADASRVIEAIGSAYERRDRESRLAALEQKLARS